MTNNQRGYISAPGELKVVSLQLLFERPKLEARVNEHV